MKTIFRLTFTSLAIAMLTIAALPTRGVADTTPQSMPVSCTAPNPDHQTGLRRPKGDGNIWTFQIVLEGGARFVSGPFWNFPGKGGNDPDWGLVTGGADGDSSMGWSSPGKTGEFQVRVNGQIACGDGGDGEPIDFSAGWDGEVSYNAEIKVKRSGTDENAYSGSATVAEGGLESDEHKADVVVIATDSDGNPIEGINVSTPDIEENFGVEKIGAISAVGSTSTDNDGKAYFTFISGDQSGSLTLKVDGGENIATATIDQKWANGNGSFPTADNDTTFTYGTPANILFKMTLDGSVPITGHDIHFKLVAISVYDWDAQGMQEYSIDVGGIPQDCLNLISIVSKQEKSPGSYPGTVTVIDDADLSITSVTIRAVDYNAYKS